MERQKAIFELRGELLKRGITIKKLAKILNRNPKTVEKVIKRWWGKPNLPRGPISKDIILKIHELLHNQTSFFSETTLNSNLCEPENSPNIVSKKQREIGL